MELKYPMAFDRQKAERIWKTVCRVPAGRVSSYGFIADLAGLPGRARLVGSIMQYAPDEMQVPWYRILKSNGQLAFVTGSKQAEKQKGLLQEEGVVVLNNRVKLKDFGWHPTLGELMELEF